MADTLQLPATITVIDSSSKTNKAMGWKVLVWNDNVNSFEHVIASLMKVIKLDKEKAEKHTLQVHKEGCSVVWSGHKEYAEAKAFHLCNEGINATIEHG